MLSATQTTTTIFRFHILYFILAVLLFFTEVLIGLYVHDAIVRPYVGDGLVVILIYCFLKSFLQLPARKTAIGVLLFSFAIEIGQYFHLVKILGLQGSALARVVIGTSFEWIDLIAYTFGVFVILIVDGLLNKERL